MEYTLYILHADTLNKFYIGYTSGSLEERIRKHSSNHKGFTSHSKDWQLAYKEKFEKKTTGIQHEKEIKNWKSSMKIKTLINSAKSVK